MLADSAHLQGYTKKMAASLRVTSQDENFQDSCHLQQLLDEFSCIHSLMAQGDSTGHKALIASPITYSGEIASYPPPDYSDAVVRAATYLHTYLIYKVSVCMDLRQVRTMLRTYAMYVYVCVEMHICMYRYDAIIWAALEQL